MIMVTNSIVWLVLMEKSNSYNAIVVQRNFVSACTSTVLEIIQHSLDLRVTYVILNYPPICELMLFNSHYSLGIFFHLTKTM